MKQTLLSASVAVSVIAILCLKLPHRELASQLNTNSIVQMPAPIEGEENEKLRERYEELRHRAAPGVSWRTIEMNNHQRLTASRQSNPPQYNQRYMPYANGAFAGEWEPRGANNLTGSVRAVDYVPSTNTLYTVSNGGSLWSSVLNSGAWTLRNQDTRFDGKILRAFTKTTSGVRVLMSTNQNIYYSDDNGQTIHPSSGISFPVGWGGNDIVSLVRLNDGSNTLYCLTRPWSASPWGPRFWLYRSTDQGLSFTKIKEFTFGDDDRLSMCVPYNSSAVYLADIGGTSGSINLYSVTGTTVSLLHTYAVGGGNDKCLLKGTYLGGVYYLYALLNNNTLYKSTNLGTSWTLQSSLPEDAWNKMNVSPSDPTQVSYGGVNAFRSTTSGTSWTKVNEWYEYYGNEANKLHADIMEIEYFKTPGNTQFAIVDCHGGTYVSYDNLATVSNQSLTSHIAVELYDVLTDTLNLNRIYGGAQDQGLQRTLTATSPGMQGFTQVISGDYGHLCLTYQNQFLWPQYPGATFYLYNNLGSASPSYINSWQMGGTEKSNYGWMLPAKSTVNLNANEIWIGGGNINGGGGSYLAKATMLTVYPYTVSATQFNYNFKANSNSGSGGVTAIEQSSLLTNRLYVATEDGTFFYSNNGGTNWNKTSSFSGPTPWYLYGSCILASHISPNVVWYGGSGYSNPPLYKSTDGGVTFTSMSNGLPSTLVNEIVASPDEELLFAATEAGPYVYVARDDMWYSLATVGTSPVQFYSNVEYLRAEHKVRFGTMGRGIWDLNITEPVTYTFIGNGNWSVAGNWSNNTIPPAELLYGSEIVINPAGSGECVLNVPQTITYGAKLTVINGKKFRVNGNLSLE